MTKSAMENLKALCVEYGFTDSVANGLMDQASYVALWKSTIRPATATATQRQDLVGRIEDLAAELQSAIAALPLDLRGALDGQYFGNVGSARLDRQMDLSDDHSELDLGGHVVPKIRASAEVVGKLLQAGEGGVSTLTERQADFIRCIAQCVMQAKMAPSNSGKFKKVCEAVFLAGGLTLPDRALRHFIKDVRPELRTRGLTL